MDRSAPAIRWSALPDLVLVDVVAWPHSLGVDGRLAASHTTGFRDSLSLYSWNPYYPHLRVICYTETHPEYRILLPLMMQHISTLTSTGTCQPAPWMELVAQSKAVRRVAADWSRCNHRVIWRETFRRSGMRKTIRTLYPSLKETRLVQRLLDAGLTREAIEETLTIKRSEDAQAQVSPMVPDAQLSLMLDVRTNLSTTTGQDSRHNHTDNRPIHRDPRRYQDTGK